MGSIDDLVLLQAAQSILNGQTLTAPHKFGAFDVKVLNTNNSKGKAQTIFAQPVAGPFGARLASVSLSVDAVFQANYDWLLSVGSVDSPGKEYSPFDPTVSTFDDVPYGFFLLKPGATITLKAYNAVSTNSNDAYISVDITTDYLTESQALILDMYTELLDNVANLYAYRPKVTKKVSSTGVT